MNILIGCEYSGIVSNAFRLRGHNVVSCDILPTESYILSSALSPELSRALSRDLSVDLSPGPSAGSSQVMSPGLSVDLSAALSLDPSLNYHYQGDIMDILNNDQTKNGYWDLCICFPPCTYLARAQAHLLNDPGRLIRHWQAIEFIEKIWAAPISKMAIENPIGLLSTKWKQPNQIVSFHHFGDPYKKDVCLWLRGLPLLSATNVVHPTKRVSNHTNSRMSKEQRGKIKSKFLPGIARAMAEQWG